MKTLATLLLVSLVSARAFAADPTPTPTPTPTPLPTIKLSDGRDYTAPQIEGMLQGQNARISDLTLERNNLAGQVIDLNTTIQKMQQQQVRVEPAPNPTPAPTPTPAPKK